MLLPYASDRPTSKPPVTVVILVLLQFVLFAIFAFGVNSSKGSYWINLYASLCLVPAHVHWYSPLTYSFLHERVFHLSANMLFLWVFGSSLEDALKWKKFLSIYLGSAILTGLLQVAITRITHGSDGLIPIVGASGAISSLIGMFAVRFYRSKISIIGLPAKVPAITLLVLTVCIEMGMTIWSIVQ